MAAKKRTVQELHNIHRLHLMGDFLIVSCLSMIAGTVGLASSSVGALELASPMLCIAVAGMVGMVPLAIKSAARIVEYDRLASEIDLIGAKSMLNLKLDRFYSKLCHTNGRRNVLVLGFEALKHPSDGTRSMVEEGYKNRTTTCPLLSRFSKDYWKAVFSPAEFR